MRKLLPKIRWHDIKPLVGASFANWNKHSTPRLGAALAFYTLLSLIPLLLILISIAGLVFGASVAHSGVLQQIRLLIGPARAKVIEALLEGARSKTGGFLTSAIGVGTLLFGASGIVVELRSDLNIIWDTPSRNLTTRQEIAGMVKEHIWSIGVVLAGGILLTASLWISTWISAASALYIPLLPGHEALLHILNSLLSFVVVTGIFAALYKIVPDVPLELRDVLLGAAVTAVLFTMGNVLLGFYLGKDSFSSTYGAAASAVLFALWVYYSSMIFFLGAEFTKVFAERHGSQRNRTRQSPPVPGNVQTERRA